MNLVFTQNVTPQELFTHLSQDGFNKRIQVSKDADMFQVTESAKSGNSAVKSWRYLTGQKKEIVASNLAGVVKCFAKEAAINKEYNVPVIRRNLAQIEASIVRSTNAKTERAIRNSFKQMRASLSEATLKADEIMKFFKELSVASIEKEMELLSEPGSRKKDFLQRMITTVTNFRGEAIKNVIIANRTPIEEAINSAAQSLKNASALMKEDQVERKGEFAQSLLTKICENATLIRKRRLNTDRIIANLDKIQGQLTQDQSTARRTEINEPFIDAVVKLRQISKEITEDKRAERLAQRGGSTSTQLSKASAISKIVEGAQALPGIALTKLVTLGVMAYNEVSSRAH